MGFGWLWIIIIWHFLDPMVWHEVLDIIPGEVRNIRGNYRRRSLEELHICEADSSTHYVLVSMVYVKDW